MIRRLLLALIAIVPVLPAFAAIVRVPQDHITIQAAIDAATAGDTILVAPGRYPERIRLTPGIMLRSDGDNRQGGNGLQRAEGTIIDGGGETGNAPGVLMTEGSTLDGFTVVNVGVYDETLWQKHFESHGEELGDDEGSVQAEGTTPAISIQGVSCTVTHCIVHHNGDVGIGILGSKNSRATPIITSNIVYRNMGGGIGVAEGAEPIIQANICNENLRAGIGCRNANPLIAENQCFQNVRAGIGCREGSMPVIRGNKCYQNRRAGIGIRMGGTSPVVESNECFENEMAGIGCRDKASPILRNNVCRNNKMAGIGCDGASPLIVGNECRDNKQAGIGVQGQASVVIHGNTCLDNVLVAIGVAGNSTATIMKNELARSGGIPPIIAVKDHSTATIRDNRISGGGVAALLVQGNANVSENTFTGVGAKQGNAVWIREGATAIVSQNSFVGYRTAINASKAKVVASENRIKGFQGAAIVVKESPWPVYVYANTGISADPKATVVDAPGISGVVENNILRAE